MALVGAVTSYISYQKKKLCFGIQQSLNTDMVKAENPEAVVAVEPQAPQGHAAVLMEHPVAAPEHEQQPHLSPPLGAVLGRMAGGWGQAPGGLGGVGVTSSSGY
ncbi:hypothetical protein PAMP_015420 [Pampus punctatissimus]